VAGQKIWQVGQLYEANVSWGGPHPTIDVQARPFLAKGDGTTNDEQDDLHGVVPQAPPGDCALRASAGLVPVRL
jgi:hypothetical protein